MKKLLSSKAILTAAAFSALLSFSAFATNAASLTTAGTVTVNVDNTTADVTISYESSEELVSAGIISRETAARMDAYAESYYNDMESKIDIESNLTGSSADGETEVYAITVSTSNLLDEMQKENIITPQEKEKIQDYYQQQAKQHFEEELENTANRYVAEQLISKETASKMVSYEKQHYSTADSAEIFTQVVTVTTTDAVETPDTDATTDSVIFSYSIFNLEELLNQGIITAAEKQAIEKSDQDYVKTFVVTTTDRETA